MIVTVLQVTMIFLDLIYRTEIHITALACNIWSKIRRLFNCIVQGENRIKRDYFLLLETPISLSSKAGYRQLPHLNIDKARTYLKLFDAKPTTHSHDARLLIHFRDSTPFFCRHLLCLRYILGLLLPT
ncbi:hypothetical protein CY34DRAFT_396793 [Suillus luteus UH-Slu-Lm8-n1]|uniref:Uncharacterized protein n=1 Tax=Suillus luteus UH-Slu-Lm8-n1 TaxID=930992 RepID=A0A0D0AVF6_9AGAM|nr:hypothetical protein CY34DRAFT_396793 [Suillus luteus UH-Slu-Lm8-n1]